MITTERTAGADPRSIALCSAMASETFPLYEAEFAAMDEATRGRVRWAFGTDQADLIEVLLALDVGEPIGRAALRALAEGGYEVKKVYVVPSACGRGFSRTLMTAIEDVARSLGETHIRLQTGVKQVDAIAVYEAIGYSHIEPFGRYVGLDSMVCFAKGL